MHFGKRNPTHSYIVNKRLLEAVHTERDFGVLVDLDLNFRDHTNMVVKKAMSLSRNLFAIFKTNDVDALSKLFVFYIRPLVEYASQVCSPRLRSSIASIERVQRKFSKLIFTRLGHPEFSYEYRLGQLSLDSLEVRRIKLDLLFLFKIIHSPFSPLSAILPPFSSAHTRFSKLTFILPPVNLSVLKNFYTMRVISIWNKLPISLRSKPTLASFKRALHSFDFSSHLGRS